MSMSKEALRRVRIDALPAHSLVGENRDLRVMAVSPGAKLSRPLLGIAFLQVRNGNGLHRLVGKFQHPLLKAQPARPRLGLERPLLFPAAD